VQNFAPTGFSLSHLGQRISIPQSQSQATLLINVCKSSYTQTLFAKHDLKDNTTRLLNIQELIVPGIR